MTQIIKYQLNESDMPRQWYNIVADMPNKRKTSHRCSR
jgi:predicted alternative tryptophan synthase beta-subunit